MGRIKSVIFDWGGVLIDDPAPGLMKYCAQALGASEEDYIRAHSKFTGEFQKGLISEAIFWMRVCAELKTPKPRASSLWGDAFRYVYSPRADMFSIVSTLHQNGYRTALLSNTEAPAMLFFHQLRYNMFDVVVFSCAAGTSKPERRIYELTVEKLGSQPAQSVYVDDKPEYVESAKEIGLHAILFESIDQVKNELARLGVKIDELKLEMDHE